MSETLPQGWIETTLKDVAELVAGKTPKLVGQYSSNKGVIPWVKVSDMNLPGNEEFVSYSAISFSFEECEKYGLPILPPETIIFPKNGGAIATGKRRRLSKNCSLDLNTMGIIPQCINTNYFFHWFNTIDLAELSDGSVVPQINKSHLHPIKFPLPPLAEQQKIVAKLEALLTRSTNARNELAAIPKLIERYKQAVLATAFETRLIEHWEVNPLEYYLADSLIGLVRSKTEQSEINGTPYIRMNHFNLQGRWNFEHLTFVTISPAELQRYELKLGDLLFNTRNSAELVGKVALWESENRGHVYNNNILRLRFTKQILPKYALYYMMSPIFRQYLESVKSATTSVAAIYQRNVNAAPFYVPDLETQMEMVLKIDSSLNAIDTIEAELTKAKALRKRLEQATLAKAFRGELVPQNPNDEPASVLLERIGAEREAQPKSKKGRRDKHG
jgi:type I restriction enzyme S subunit